MFDYSVFRLFTCRTRSRQTNHFSNDSWIFSRVISIDFSNDSSTFVQDSLIGSSNDSSNDSSSSAQVISIDSSNAIESSMIENLIENDFSTFVRGIFL